MEAREWRTDLVQQLSSKVTSVFFSQLGAAMDAEASNGGREATPLPTLPFDAWSRLVRDFLGAPLFDLLSRGLYRAYAMGVSPSRYCYFVRTTFSSVFESNQRAYNDICFIFEQALDAFQSVEKRLNGAFAAGRLLWRSEGVDFLDEGVDSDSEDMTWVRHFELRRRIDGSTAIALLSLRYTQPLDELVGNVLIHWRAECLSEGGLYRSVCPSWFLRQGDESRSVDDVVQRMGPLVLDGLRSTERLLPEPAAAFA
jgi:hypothetical protein